MKSIPLTRSLWTVVDDEDYEHLSAHDWHARKPGTAAGYYATTTVDGKPVMMHRMIMKPAEGFTVDHIDGNTLNNTRSNLRVCLQSENAKNRRSRIGRRLPKGVYLHPKSGRYRAQIMVNGKRIDLGYHPTIEAAAAAYREAALKYYGEFARGGTP
jgi:hypothetical protein